MRSIRPVTGRRSPLWCSLVILPSLLLGIGCRLIYLEARDLPRSPRPAAKELGSVLVGVVTSPSPDPDRHMHGTVTFRFASVDGSRRFRVLSAQPTVFPLRSAEETADPGFEAVAGKLFAVQVDPGEYELVSVDVFNQFTRTVDFEPRPRVGVGPGEIVYIGSFEVTNCYSVYVTPQGERRRETTAGGFLAIRDRGDHDIPLLRSAFPDLTNAEIVPRVVDAEAIVNRASELLSSRCSYELGQ